MTQLLTDTTAVVTGASSGIGRGIATTFADHGADVVVADIREEPREGGVPTHELIEDETDSRSTFVECDVSRIDDLEAAMDAAEGFGGVGVMVNNAVTRTTRPESFVDITEEEYDRLMGVNLKGVFFGCQVAAKRMLERGDGGSIINASSGAGFLGATGFDRSVYGSAKAAIVVLTYTLGGELGPEGIRVNAVVPGPTKTMMTTGDPEHTDPEQEERTRRNIPLGRWARPEDVAKGYLFLASDLAEFVNAEVLFVDGGRNHTS